jgi:hypothetical protein
MTAFFNTDMIRSKTLRAMREYYLIVYRIHYYFMFAARKLPHGKINLFIHLPTPNPQTLFEKNKMKTCGKKGIITVKMTFVYFTQVA